jgi:release factor glutamine methyltransferase
VGGARPLQPGGRRLDRSALAERLGRAGFLAAAEEADALITGAAGDRALLAALLARRLTGEPLAWITGTATFCGLEIRIDPGVYIPRPHTEQLARRAGERLPAAGIAVDLCTGSGAVAKALSVHRPGARVLATDIDARAVACASCNGVEAYRGDLFSPLPAGLAGRLDVLAGVVPYVPTPALRLLQRDTFTFETPLAYDGGPDGAAILRRAIAEGARFLRRGGTLLLELGGDQADAVTDDLERAGYVDVAVLADEDGDARGIEATLGERR